MCTDVPPGVARAAIGAVSYGISAEVHAALENHSMAVMLYGSQARGHARLDSDVDVLQLVAGRPRSYSAGRVNVAAYTPDHLSYMAQSGSLFIRHLCDEGIVLEDPHGTLASILSTYRAPTDYAPLKTELAVILAATAASGADEYRAGIRRLASYAVRTALYVRCAESGHIIFDVDQACKAMKLPKLAELLRTREKADLSLLGSAGMNLLSTKIPADIPQDFTSIVVWSGRDFPQAAQMLEAVITGEQQINYTALTLPLM
jgi:hypothetical protein